MHKEKKQIKELYSSLPKELKQVIEKRHQGEK